MTRTITLVTVDCVCCGRNPACVQCAGTGSLTREACRRCTGTGRSGGDSKCLDCRGQGWRELDLLDQG